jgi:hypothetical protein
LETDKAAVVCVPFHLPVVFPTLQTLSLEITCDPFLANFLFD